MVHILGENQGGSSSFTSGTHWMPILDIDMENNKVYVSNPNSHGETGWIDIDKVLTSAEDVILMTNPNPNDEGPSSEGSSYTVGSGFEAGAGSAILVEPNEGATSFKVIYHEVSAPKGFALLKDDIVIEYRSTDGGKTWSPASTNITLATGNEKVKVIGNGDRYTYKIQAENRRKIMIDLSKVDTEDKELANRLFDVAVGNGVFEDTAGISNGSASGTITTKADGKIHIEIIPDGKSSVTLTLNEHKDQYYSDLAQITVEFEYMEATGDWHAAIKSTVNKVPNNGNGQNQVAITGTTEFNLKIINVAKIEDLELEKVNKLIESETIPGIGFEINLTNARDLDGKQRIYKETGADGKFNLGEIQIDKPSQDVVISIKETSTPSDLNGKVNFLDEGQTVTITLRHMAGGSLRTVGDFTNATYNTATNKVSVTLANRVAIDLSGMVWEDVQHGDKPVIAPNGYREGDESGMAGVIVKLFNADGTPAKDFAGNAIAQKITGADGSYKFEELPASIHGTIRYYVAFSYDGINFITVEKHAPGSTPETDSDVDEVNRTAFNNRFETITKGQSNDGTTLEYDHSADGKIATLITKNSNGTVLDKFAMTANTDNTYGYITEHIDMGLEKKEVDLAAVTEIEEVQVSINGKTRTYNKYYDGWATLPDENIVIEDFQNDDITYSLYLYDSDYNYRINMYQLDQATESDMAVYTNYDDYAKGKNEAELDAQFTYKVLLNNQSATTATVNDIAYYYDARLIRVDENGNNIDSAVTDNINGIKYKKLQLDTKATLGTGAQVTAKLYFKLDKSYSKAQLEERPIKNWVEITSYSTDVGCIDKDSAPDDITENQATPYIEDDSDDAKGVLVNIDTTPRTISGYVFEDMGRNGLYDEGTDAKVNEVIVQLIEVKEVEGIKLEYIWQETVAGSKDNQNKNIKWLTTNGTQGSYGHNNNDGEFYFEGFITGDYIVRFIYGDKTYYDYTIDGSQTSNPAKATIEKYNGLYYQSTIDECYSNDKWIEGYYTYNRSMARDNESRRLIQMYNATNNSLDPTNKAEFLDKTWVCAETSKIIYDPDAAPEVVALIGKRGINFGLARRPEVKLQLVKHITNLSVGDSLNTSAKIDDYSDANGNVILTDYGSRKVKTAEASLREKHKIGKWFVELPVDDINNQNVHITYEYLVKNIGDRISVGNKLASVPSEQYMNVANNIKNEQYKANSDTYKIGDYLGRAYYTDLNGEQLLNNYEQEVALNVKIEDYLSTNINLPQIKETDNFEKLSDVEKNIIKLDNQPGTEIVKVIQTKAFDLTSGDSKDTKQVVSTKTNATLGKEFTYRSYSARAFVVGKDGKETNITNTGLPIDLQDLPYVYTYYNGPNITFEDLAPADNHYIAETVEITVNTGGDDPETKTVESNTLRIAEIVAGSMAIIAVGLVLIKKFAIKK